MQWHYLYSQYCISPTSISKTFISPQIEILCLLSNSSPFPSAQPLPGLPPSIVSCLASVAAWICGLCTMLCSLWGLPHQHQWVSPCVIPMLTRSKHQQLHLLRGSRTCLLPPHSWAPILDLPITISCLDYCSRLFLGLPDSLPLPLPSPEGSGEHLSQIKAQNLPVAPFHLR